MSISVPVDFGNCDVDNAVRLTTKGTVDALKWEGIQLKDGMELTITDGELTAIGIVCIQDGMWVAQIVRWL